MWERETVIDIDGIYYRKGEESRRKKKGRDSHRYRQKI